MGSFFGEGPEIAGAAHVQVDGREYSFTPSARGVSASGNPDAVHLFDGDAEMTVVHDGANVAGTIMDPHSMNVVTFMGNDGGDVQFTSRSSNDFPEEDVRVAEGVEADALEEVETSSKAAVLTVMIAWTVKAECANAGKSAGCRVDSSTKSKMQALIKLAMEETNSGYAMSGIQTRLQLVKSLRTGYKEVAGDAFSSALNSITGTNDGVLDWIHKERAAAKADVVALIIDDSQYCGLAWLGPSKSRMFSVTSWSCATGYYSFGHEIGHNLGCNHDRGTKRACGSSQSNYGFREPSGAWRTVLAYGCRTDQCDRNGGRGCRRMPFYSNPYKTYQGRATGVKGQSNNAAQIDKVAPTVAGYF